MFKQVIKTAFLLSICWIANAQAIAVSAIRVWPAQDYTRITIESKRAITYNQFIIKNPERLVIDLDNVEINELLTSLSSKIGSDDPYIKSVRVGRYKPGVVRLVLDLKTEVKQQLFNLKPVANYGHRLVLDVYPVHPVDPIIALLQSSGVSILSSDPANTSTPDAAGSTDPAVTSLPPQQDTAPVNPDMGVAHGRRTIIIAIDPGHGGEDPGARGRRGTEEKDITLAISRRLKAQIDDTPGMRAYLIRDGDFYLSLGARVAKAHQAHADLLVSIHADAWIKPNARGSSVFALSERGATSANARWLAKKENEADLIGGVNISSRDPHLARTLLDLSRTATVSDSLKLANHVLGELGGINKLHRGKVEQAGFAVLKSPEIPSILVETAFISNPTEEARLIDGAYQEKMAQAVLGGIKRYFAKNPPLSKQRIAQNN